MFFQVTVLTLLILLAGIELVGLSRSANARRGVRFLYVLVLPIFCLFIYQVLLTVWPIIPKG